MRDWLRRTRVRLALTSTLLLAVLAVGSAVGVWFVLRSQEFQTVDRDLRTEMTRLLSGVSDNNGQITFEGGDPLPPPTVGDAAVRAVLFVDGVATARVGQAPSVEAARTAAHALGAEQGPVLVTVDDGGRHLRLAASVVPDRAGAVLVVARDLTPVDERLARDAVLLAVSVVAVVLGSAVLAYRQAGRALRPVGAIAATARAISEHDLSRRVELDLPDDELGDLVATFNGMLDRLQASFAAQRRFTADAAHEMRAPLTLMRTQVELALGRAGDAPPAMVDTLRAVLGDVERLSSVVERLLVLARADSGALVVERERIDVVDLVEETAARWRGFAATRQVEVATETPMVGWLEGDRHLLRSVLDNLVDNAVRHSPPGGRVVIGARPNDDRRWVLSVDDDGPGVPPEFRSRLFSRFARPDAGRHRSTGGAGLGLAVVKAIVDAHGGEVVVLDRTPGTRVEVRLPLRGDVAGPAGVTSPEDSWARRRGAGRMPPPPGYR